jgi:hypothetical protein
LISGIRSRDDMKTKASTVVSRGAIASTSGSVARSMNKSRSSA